MKQINLFCLPFAGGNKYSYREYQINCPSQLNIVPIEYSGRGSRMSTELMSNMDDVLQDVFDLIKNKLNQAEYAIYGHSMGATVGFELIHLIIKNNYKLPLHFFVTGTMGPSVINRIGRNWHLLPKDKFIQKLKQLEGCPEEVFRDNELFDFFEPIIRSDFKVLESFQYVRKPPLNIPITVITGTEESMDEEDIRSWQFETTIQVDFRKMKGSHFFIFKYPIDIIELISQKLSLIN